MNNAQYVSDTVTPALIDAFLRAIFLRKEGDVHEPDLFARYNSVEGVRQLVGMLNPQRAEIVSVYFGLRSGQPLLQYAATARVISEQRSNTTVRHHLRKALNTMLHGARDLRAKAETPATDGTPIRESGLSERVGNFLYRMGINTVEELDGKTVDDLLGHSWFGPHSLNEVRAMLAKRGKYLKGERPLPTKGRSGDRDMPDPSSMDLDF